MVKKKLATERIEPVLIGVEGFTECLFKTPFSTFSITSVVKIGMLKICILALISALWVGGAYAQQKPESIGTVTAVKGQVTVTSGGVSEQVNQGASVFLGDRLQTGDNSGAKILFNDDTLISLGANTKFEITEFVYNPAKRKSISNVLTGKIKAIIQKFEGESDVQFVTPKGIAGVKGTILFIDADKGIFFALEREVFVRGTVPGAREIKLEPGEFTTIGPNGNPLNAAPIPDALKNDLQQGTQVNEETPSRDSLYKHNYPGKKPPHTGILSELGAVAPLEQPADLLPGVNQKDEAPVDVIVVPH
jgi:FecR protein